MIPGAAFCALPASISRRWPNFYFEAHNRGKRSIALDLKKPEGRAIVLRLVERADVFVQNFRPGAAERLGLDYASLKPSNPKLIYASGSGFGRRGPDAERPCMDYLGLARSGIMNAVGEPDGPPMAVQGAIADQMAGTMLAFGIMTALLTRERFGIGQEVDCSLLGAMSWLQGLSVASRLMLGGRCRASRARPHSIRSGITIAARMDAGSPSRWRKPTDGGRASSVSSADPTSRPTSASRRSETAACMLPKRSGFSTRSSRLSPRRNGRSASTRAATSSTRW